MKLTDRERWILCEGYSFGRASTPEGEFSSVVEHVEEQDALGLIPPSPTCAGWTRVEDGLPPVHKTVPIETNSGIEFGDLMRDGDWVIDGDFIVKRVHVTRWFDIPSPTQPCRCGEMERDLEAAIDAAEANAEMVICYRLGGRPTEKLFTRLERGRKFLAKYRKEG